MAKQLCKCKYCGQTFDRVTTPFVQVSDRRYAHRECAISEQERITKEQKEKEELENYINFLLGTKTLSQKVRRQLKEYREEYHYTNTGMLKTLQYMYEIKHNSPEKMNGGVGIIGYTYQDAQNYYYKIWLANESNKDKKIEAFIPEVKEIKIETPVRKVSKRQLFTFLDEEGDD